MTSLEEVAGAPPPHGTPWMGILDPAERCSNSWIIKPREEVLDEMGR
jgi:hypothetical protein